MGFIDWLIKEKKKAIKKKRAVPKKKKAATVKAPTVMKTPVKKPYIKKTGYTKPYIPKVNPEKYRPKYQTKNMFDNDDMEGIGFHGGSLNLKPQPKPKKEVKMELIEVPKPNTYIEVHTMKSMAVGKYPVTWKYSNSTKYNRMWFESLTEARQFAAGKSREMKIRITEINSELTKR